MTKKERKQIYKDLWHLFTMLGQHKDDEAENYWDYVESFAINRHEEEIRKNK